MNPQITIITVAAVLGLGLLLAGWWMLKGVPQSVSTSERADETANDIVGATPSTTPADQGTQKPRQEDRSKISSKLLKERTSRSTFGAKLSIRMVDQLQT